MACELLRSLIQRIKKMMRNRVALVTGAASGIGRATAIAFAREGASVVVADVDRTGGDETVRAINALDGKAIYIACDVSKANEIESLIERTVSTFGRLDYAFNNAGVEGLTAPVADCSLENWEQTIKVNLRGVLLCMKYEIQQMLKQGAGAIVNCSSIAGMIGFPGIPAYVASKHGVIGLTKNAALEYAEKKIRVNAVCPGVIRTPMIDRFTKSDPKAYAQLVAAEPIARIGEPEEIAEAVLWLCSDKSSFVTGHSLVADGGWVAR